jgi:hypothetical protein
MEDGICTVGQLTGLPGKYFRPWNLTNRHAQMKHCTGQMFGRMNRAIHAQNPLRARNLHVVDELMTEMPEPGTIPGAREGCHRCALVAAVKVEAKLWPPTAKRTQFKWQNLIEVGILFKDGAEPVFHDDGKPQVRTEAFQNVERGCGEYTISQRPQPEDGDPASRRQVFQSATHGGLFFDLRLVDQHHGDIVANGVDAMALDTFQTTLVGLEVNHGLADGTDEDLQELFADSHSESSV